MGQQGTGNGPDRRPIFKRSAENRGLKELRGWPYRTRTSMCKVKIHLFELSTMLGFTHASADRPVVPEE
jgi:hypothetical protein